MRKSYFRLINLSGITPGTGWFYPDLYDFCFKLIVSGESFVLKNSKKIVRAGKRLSLVPSSRATEWMRTASEQLKYQWAQIFSKPIPAHIEINAEIRTYLSTRRRADASNLYQSVEDVLQSCTSRCKPGCAKHAGVIVDDYQVRTHNGSDRLYDKNNPRVEIILTRYRGGT